MSKRFKSILCLAAAISMIVSSVAFAAPEGKVASEKKDSILVETDASGNITGKTANVTITGSNSTDPIIDRSNLSNIVNVSGTESFTKNEDGTIVWENKGDDITYKGNLNEELPFRMKVVYYLNDKEIAPEELAGKTGHLKVEYSFENLVAKDVEVDGEVYHTYVPFYAITGIFLPQEHFTNVDPLKNGGMAAEEFGDQEFLMGVATPGCNEALNLEIMGLDKYVNFPSSFGFTADVTDCEMPSVVTYVMPYAPDKIDFSIVKTDDEITSKIEELVEASQKILNGSSQLADGTNQLSNGAVQFVSELNKGLKAISDGSVQFDDELYNLEVKKDELAGEAEELINYLNGILIQLNELKLPDEESVFSPELMAAEEQLKKDAALLIDALEVMKSQLEEIQAFGVEAQEYIDEMTEIGNTVYTELSAIDMDQIVADATEIAKQQVIQAAKEEFANLPISDEEIDSIAERLMAHVDVSAAVEEPKQHVAKVEEVLSDLPEIEIPEFQVDVDPVIEILHDMETQFTVVEKASGKQDELKGLLNSANKFVTSVKSDSDVLKKKSRELVSGLDFADNMIQMAHSYMNTLNQSVSEASNGSKKLADGAGQVDDGARTLADGTKQYYNDGVLTAADYARQATMKAFVNRCRAFILAADLYTNISGKEELTRGNIGFVVRTAAITASN